jgi:uncharacterized protein with HEPN domain
MSRDESLYLGDIQESCEKILRFTKGMTYKEFIHDDLHFDAVLRNLEVIGDSCKAHLRRNTDHIPKCQLAENCWVP